ncbi:ABC transporter ATP-binding protein [Grimontia sp. SpTr1]|uniref:ABC transporter ATP-binding protein n=1 Tax=Grimontia sp. SpTr1 TaxID=2995319 RepID=UPI00248B4D30|nr:ABC transporter ATP-binding protein [Grimontia sp. SpTr1]
MDKSILFIIKRVIKHSQASPTLFVKGALFRTFEKGLDIFPILVCYWWFISTWEGDDENSSFFNIAGSSFEILDVVILLIVVFVFQFIFSWLGQKYSFLGGYGIMSGYRRKVLDKIHSMPLSTLYRYRSGYLSELVTDDTTRIENIFTHLAIDLFTSLLIPFLILGSLLLLDWRAAIILIAGFPLAILFVQGTRKIFNKVSQKKLNANREVSGVIVEFVMGIKTLRLFNYSQQWLSKLELLFSEMTRKSVTVEVWGAGPVVLYRLIVEIGLVAFLFWCGSQVESGTFQPHITVLFIFLAYRLISPLLDMAQYLNIIRYAAQSEMKSEEVIRFESLPEPPIKMQAEHYSVQFDNVSFNYDETPCLKNISFIAKHHEVTAIVGPSGSGKTTLFNLICRFSDPSTGTVNIGNCSLRDIGTTGVYDNISMVFQDVQLFASSIMENIRIGRKEASDEEVYEACKKAFCLEFISQLPQGFDTQIGEGGTRLSGGERQRISIARAYLKNSPILLLDEITASVDSVAQYEIQQALMGLVEGKTVIVIAHRLSAIKTADQILVLDKGEIVQAGRHQDLVEQAGLYQTLWFAQSVQR